MRKTKYRLINYTDILLCFLFQTSIICSNSLSDYCSGDSEDILIKCDKLNSDSLFRSRDLIVFICEKLLSTDAVVTGIVRQILASVLRFGYIAPISSVVVNSCN